MLFSSSIGEMVNTELNNFRMQTIVHMLIERCYLLNFLPLILNTYFQYGSDGGDAAPVPGGLDGQTDHRGKTSLYRRPQDTGGTAH